MEKPIEENNKKEIILGLDVSTTTIGCAVILNDGSDYGKIIELTHVAPKVNKNINHTESLFLKKKIFKEEFLNKWKDFGITKVVIEEPLLSSNNVNTVGVLLRFNGMISDCIYEVLGIVPEYISSYEARQFAFPSLMDVRHKNKKNEMLTKNKIKKALNDNKVVLFGNYDFDCNKKEIILSNVMKIFPQITWIYNKKNELKKENFDACDAYVACLGFLNKNRYKTIDFQTTILKDNDNEIEYEISYWNKKINRNILF